MTNEHPSSRKRVDVDATGSEHRGLLGLYESTMRRSKAFGQVVTTLPLYFLAVALIGAALVPAVALFTWASALAASVPGWRSHLVHGLALAGGYFAFGFSLLVVVAIANFPLRFIVRPARGSFHSVQFIPWYAHNALLYMVRYTFLDFITPTPINVSFLRAMGMKIGRDCQVNTSYISDPALLVIEDKVTIGGSATIIAHYGMSGYLILAPVIIRKGAVIGLRACILGGVEIGERATVLPNSVVLPKTRIPAGETWGGVPAQKIQPKA